MLTSYLAIGAVAPTALVFAARVLFASSSAVSGVSSGLVQRGMKHD